MLQNEHVYYLKEDVYFEPLFNQWYAWIYLISPVCAARHMTHTHKRIMNSFVNNYQLHILAANEPGMEGSEFMNCQEQDLPVIKKLLADIDQNQQDLVELSNAVKDLDQLLIEHNRGESVEKLYSKVPGPLKGYVELFVDMEHNPSFRLFESLLYQSKFYKKDLQTVSFGMLSKVKERPFCFSTPRLADENHIQLKIDFSSTVLDELLGARTKPISGQRIKQIFNQYQLAGGLDFNNLFTDKASEYLHKIPSGSVKLDYLGHAGLMIQTNEISILVDPVIASRDIKNGDKLVSFSQLPQNIDYIFITHSHQDHACIETLLQLRHKVGSVVVPRNNGGTLVDPSLKIMLQNFNFNVIELDEMEVVNFSQGYAMSLPFVGEHGDLNIRSKTAWVFKLNEKKIFVGADTSNLDPNIYRNVHKILGDMDVLAIGMECVGAPYTWIYGALCSTPIPKKIKNNRRLNGSDADKAIELVKLFNPQKVYLYALGLEPWYKYFMGIEYDENSKQIKESKKFKAMCEAIEVKSHSLYGKHEIYI